MLQSAAKGGGLSSRLIGVTHWSCDAVVAGVVYCICKQRCLILDAVSST